MALRAQEERAIYEQLAEEASQRLAELQKALDERPRNPPDADPANAKTI
jgi:type I restriction enzyme R subunit